MGYIRTDNNIGVMYFDNAGLACSCHLRVSGNFALPSQAHDRLGGASRGLDDDEADFDTMVEDEANFVVSQPTTPTDHMGQSQQRSPSLDHVAGSEASANPDSDEEKRSQAESNTLDIASPSKRRRMRATRAYVNEFLDECDGAAPDGSTVSSDICIDVDGITEAIRNIREQVTREKAHWPAEVQHLAIGAIAVHRLRLQDTTLREEVMILHLIEGGTHLRAHDGQFYVYSSTGHWDRYRGLMSQSVLARTKRYLLQLEGLFLKFAASTDRTPDGIAGQVDFLFERLNSNVQHFVAVIETASINEGGCKGRGKGKGKGGKDQDSSH